MPASDEEVKTAKIMWFKEESTEIYKAGYMLSFEGETLLLRETVTTLSRVDVIHTGLGSFWCMIHAPMSIIIPIL